MIFTASSRSRNTGDPVFHFRIALFSNGWWYITNLLIFSLIYGSMKEADTLAPLVVFGLLYTICTSLGSSIGMKVMKRFEFGLRKIGA